MQQIVGKFDIGFVDFVDQEHRLGIAFECLPHTAFNDVVADVLHFGVAQLRIAQARDGVVFVQALLRFGGGLDVPAIQRTIERSRHFFR